MLDFISRLLTNIFYSFNYSFFYISKSISMSGKRTFNQYLWNIGKQIEDELLPKINSAFGCEFERSDDIFDIIDFKDAIKKKAVEVKGRRNTHDKYDTTIITCGKLTEALMKVECGWDVYFFFVFTNKTMYIKVDKDNCDWDVKLTGTNHIPHYLIPIKELTEFDENNFSC